MVCLLLTRVCRIVNFIDSPAYILFTTQKKCEVIQIKQTRIVHVHFLLTTPTSNILVHSFRSIQSFYDRHLMGRIRHQKCPTLTLYSNYEIYMPNFTVAQLGHFYVYARTLARGLRGCQPLNVKAPAGSGFEGTKFPKAIELSRMRSTIHVSLIEAYF